MEVLVPKLSSQFRHADDDVWACTEWEPQSIVQEIKASTGRLERWERVMKNVKT